MEHTLKRRTFGAQPISTSAAALDTLRGPPIRRMGMEAARRPRKRGESTWDAPETPIDITRSEIVLGPRDLIFRVSSIPGLAARLRVLSGKGIIQKTVPSFRIEGESVVFREKERAAFFKSLKSLGYSSDATRNIWGTRRTAADEQRVLAHVVELIDKDALPIDLRGGASLVAGKTLRSYLHASPPRGRASYARRTWGNQEAKRRIELDLYVSYLRRLKAEAPQRFLDEIKNDSFLREIAIRFGLEK